MGNLLSLRDWGNVRDYVTMEMEWLMLQQEQPKDFVIATVSQESVLRFIGRTAQHLGWGSMQQDVESTAKVSWRGDAGAAAVRIDRQYCCPARRR